MILSIRCTWILIASLLAPLTLVSANPPQTEAPRMSPNEVLRSAQTIFIRSKSVYFKASTLENSLLQQDEFQQWGLVITREESDADLIIEVGRKVFTTSFIFSVIDPRHKRVVASGRVNSIGGTVEGKITDSFMKKMRAARSQKAEVRGQRSEVRGQKSEVRSHSFGHVQRMGAEEWCD